MSFADELTDEFGGGTTECPACENDGQPCNLCKPGSIPVGFADEDRIRAIVRAEIAAWLRQSTQTTGGGSATYREYLRDRDEPPAVPPMRQRPPPPPPPPPNELVIRGRVINTTEPL